MVGIHAFGGGGAVVDGGGGADGEGERGEAEPVEILGTNL